MDASKAQRDKATMGGQVPKILLGIAALAVATALGCAANQGAVADDAPPEDQSFGGAMVAGDANPALRVMEQLIAVEAWGVEADCRCDDYYGDSGISPESCSEYYVGSVDERRQYLQCLDEHLADDDRRGARTHQILDCTADGLQQMVACFVDVERQGIDLCGAGGQEALDACEESSQQAIARCAGVADVDDLGRQFNEALAWVDDAIFEAAAAGQCKLGGLSTH